MTKQNSDSVPPEQVAKLRDAGLKRMLQTPPKRHKDEPSKEPNPRRPKDRE